MRLKDITSEHIRQYREEVLKTSSASTFDRKMFSLKKFFEWAVKNGRLDQNPVEEFLRAEQEVIQTKLGKIERQRKLATPSYDSVQARIVAKLAGIPKLQKLTYSIFYNRPKWYKTYHNLPIANYFNYAILIILMSGLGFGIYNNFFKATSESLAYPTTLTSAGRFLSFQGRLTNKLGNPITAVTNLDFKLYDASQSGTLLWDSGSCPIDPDTDGIFSSLLGSDCGDEIGSDVFSENSAVWLGVTVGVDAEATPRVQIATVAYALNSETLQGYPASESATANTVPVMNSSGQIVLASSSPKLQSTSGNFSIEGQALTITTPTGTNGSVTINPDGTGTLDLIFEGSAPGGTAGGFVNATNTNITSGALYYGAVASNATGYNLLQLQAGDTPANRFTIDAVGNATASGTINGLTVNAGSISGGAWNGSLIGTQYGGTGQNWSSVAQGSLPYFNGTGAMSTLAPATQNYVLTTQGASANPQWKDVNTLVPAAINYWQLNNKVLSPANTTYDLTVGGAATGSAFQVYAATGNVTLADLAITGGNINPSANLTIGDNGDTLYLNSSDWDIGATGDMSGIGAITADGTISFTGTTIGLGTSNSITTFNMGTGTAGNTLNLATNNTTKDTINLGSALDDVIINGAGANSIINFANFDVATTGEITTASNINVNGGNILSSGDLTINPTGGDVNITGTLDISSTLALGSGASIDANRILNLVNTSTTDATGYGIYNSNTFNFTATTNRNLYNIYNYQNSSTLNDGGNSINMYGTYNEQQIQSGSNLTAAYGTYNKILSWLGTAGDMSLGMYGTYNDITYLAASAETVPLVYGDRSYISSQGQYSTITNAYGFKSNIQETSSGTITNAYGFHSECTGADNCYGLYVDAGGATTDWGIYATGEDKNYLSGPLGIGDTTPSYALDVAGDINLTGALRDNTSAGTSGQILSSTGTGIAWIDATTGGSSLWQRTSNSLAPLNITDSLNLGATATSSALVHLAGTSGENSWIYTGNFGVGTRTPGSLLSLQSVAVNESATLGTELLSASGWTSTGWTGSWAGGWDHTTGNTTALSNTLAAGSGNYYQIAYTVSGRTAGTFTITYGGVTSGDTSATGTWGPRAVSTGALSITPTTDFDGAIILSIKQITANTAPAFALYDNTGTSNFEIRSSTATLENTYIGKNSGAKNTTGYWNVGIGTNALLANTTGNHNVALGYSSLQANTTGGYNFGMGYYSLYTNTSGTDNIGIGPNALHDNTSGSYNVALGSGALNDNTTGLNNVAIGNGALETNTNGMRNVAIGMYALDANSGGHFNVAVGALSLLNGTGGYNSVLGNQAGRTITSGTYNTFIGNDAGYNASQLAAATNSMALGNGAYTTASNQIVLGNTSVTNLTTTAAINAGGGISAATYNAFASSGDTVASTAITAANDLFIGGDTEIKGGLYLTGRNIFNVVGGVSTGAITLATTPTATNNFNTLTYGSWLINNSTNNGIAALMVNQTKGTAALGDIFTASASGATKFTVHNDSSFTMAGLSSAPTGNTTAGTVYYDTDTVTGDGTTGSLYLRGADSAWHRVALDMTAYSSASASIASGSYISIAHNQNTTDIASTGWVYDTISSTWKNISDFTNTIIQNLQNQFDASGSAKTRTQTRLTNIELQPGVDVGNGSDGDITVSSNTNINTTNLISGRTCDDGGDAVNYNITAFNAGGTEATLSSPPSPGCLSAGDEVLVINLQGASTAYSNVGNYEVLKILSVSSSTVTFTTSKTNYYGDGLSDDTNLGVTEGTQRVMLQRVPNYNDVTVASSYTFSPSTWDGTKGGVMFFRANGSVSIAGSIDASAKGYRGNKSTSTTTVADGGESFCSEEAGGDGAIGGAGVTATAATAGLCGGGAGGAATYTAGTSGSNTGGAGGGGGGIYVSTATAYYGGGGGGGGYGTFGYAGESRDAASWGTDGGTNVSGDGGDRTSTHPGSGGGGGTYGTADLSKLIFGSAGAAGGIGQNSTPTHYGHGTGGNGGGIVYISANSITVNGFIKSVGEGGTYSGSAGSGGGGAGGSIRLEINTAILGSSLVTAAGGAGGDNGGATGGNGGNGGTGRVAIYYADSITGTTSPAATSTEVGYNSYGVYTSPVIPTSNAKSYGNISWEEDLDTYGNISIQTRSGDSVDPTDGTWEPWRPFVSDTNYTLLQSMNTEGDWTGTNVTVANGDVARNVNYYEDEDEPTVGNTTKGTSSTDGGTMEATLSPSVNVSGYDYITFWVRASQTGNVLRIGMGESAATEQYEDISIDATDTWQKVYWDISDITGTDIDAITKLRFTNYSTTSNVFYVDNIRAEKLLTTQGGSKITSTPHDNLQYRAIFTTTNLSYQPKLNNVNVDYNNGFEIVQADANTVNLYNYTDETQNLKLEVTVFGADLAEWYTVDDNTIEAGDLVAVTGQTDDKGVPVLTKAKTKSDPNLIGVISTNAGQTLGIKADNRRLLALAGRVPVKIDPASPAISAGDGITSSNKPGFAQKASFGDIVIGKAAQNWKQGDGSTLFVIVASSGSQNTYLTSIENYQLVKDLVTDTWKVVENTTGEIAENASVFANMIAANIKAGAIVAGDLFAEKFEATVATIQDLTAPKIATNFISPLPGETDVTIQIGSEATPSGQFAIENSEGDNVATIDNEGNATFSGTLYADAIESKSLDEIKELLTNVQTDQSLLAQASSWGLSSSSNSANLSQLALNDLYVTNQAAVSSLSVTNSLTIGADLILDSDSSFNTLSSPLKIQSLAMAPIEIMAGLIRIDTLGNVQITGNLAVGGRVNSTGLTLKENQLQASDSASLLSLQNIDGNTVSTIDASGSAVFSSISTQGLTIAGARDATNSATVDGVITTNATAGSGVIAAGNSEITIRNNNVTDYTLVYVTPTSSTENYVLYVKSKTSGEFVVGFTNPINIDVNFNWWIVKVSE